MWMVLGLTSFFVFIIFLILTLIARKRKEPVKKKLITTAAAFAVLIVAVENDPSNTETPQVIASPTATSSVVVAVESETPVVSASPDAVTKETAAAMKNAQETPTATEADKANAEYDYTLTFPSNEYPETALHIFGAIEQGHSAICTIDRAGADENRKLSLAGVDTRDGYDRDEWPMAICAEGGKGASVAYINASDNRGAGSWVGHQLSAYEDGSRVQFVVEKPEIKFPGQAAEKSPEPSKESTETKPKPSKTPEPSPEPEVEYVYYPNCAAVKKAGEAPLYEGEPGYSTKLDRDRDGVACE